MDNALVGLSDGTILLVVLAVPYFSACGTRGTRTTSRSGGRAARLGFTLGAGHVTSLFAFGLPIVLWRAICRRRCSSGAETLSGF